MDDIKNEDRRILVVAANADQAKQAKTTAYTGPQYTVVPAHRPIVGRAFDEVVYLPGWKGDNVPAAEQWREAIVRPRARVRGQLKEVEL